MIPVLRKAAQSNIKYRKNRVPPDKVTALIETYSNRKAGLIFKVKSASPSKSESKSKSAF